MTVGLLVVGTPVGTDVAVGAAVGAYEMVGSKVGNDVGIGEADGEGVVGRLVGDLVDEVGAAVGEQSDVYEPAPPVAQTVPSDASRDHEISVGYAGAQCGLASHVCRTAEFRSAALLPR